MRTDYLIDENVLAALLKEGSEQVWQITYAHYRTPFVQHIKRRNDLGAEESRQLFREVFSLLVQSLRERLIRTPLKNTLFAHLVGLGEQKLAHAGHEVASTALPRMPYLAGEVLILLIHDGNKCAFSTLVSQYSSPICQIIKSKYYYIDESPMEVLGESLMALKANIEEGKLRLPLKARLFTYTYRIARFKFLAFVKLLKKLAPLESEEELEEQFTKAAAQEEGASYADLLSELWPILALWLEGQPEEHFEELIAQFNETTKEILRLRFVEGMKYKEIAPLVALSEVACRRRLMDALIKWRKAFLHKE